LASAHKLQTGNMWRANELLLCKLKTVDAKAKIIFTYTWYNESLLATGIHRLFERWYWPELFGRDLA